MSKLDAMRAMREANYAASQARADKPAARPKPAAAAPKPRAATRAGAESSADPAGEELCGHRNMSGRTCTREKAHSAKSHRYS